MSKTAPTAKECVRCGTRFLCGPAPGAERCWCDALPPIAPMSEEGCLCEACLRTEIEALVAGRAGLCGSCANARILKTKSEAGIVFCGAAGGDSGPPKYPRLPVLSCPSHAPRSGGPRAC